VLPLVVFAAWVLTTVISRTIRRLMHLNLESQGGPA
jgi:hypothetical protein